MSVESVDEGMVADERDADDTRRRRIQSVSTSSWASWRRSLHLLPRRSVIFLIELYRTWVSPLRLPTCRFEPTCSGYAVEALTRHGFLYGGLLSVVRLLKCGPWHKPGYDPVPDHGFAETRFGRTRFAHMLRGDFSGPTDVRGI